MLIRAEYIKLLKLLFNKIIVNIYLQILLKIQIITNIQTYIFSEFVIQ